MNILTSTKQKDPFDQSDRDPFHPHGGKGDRDRTVRSAFNEGYDSVNWSPRESRPGKTTKVYGPPRPKTPRLRIVVK